MSSLLWGRDPESGHLRFLRGPQPQALETYWYLRLIEETQHVFDLYARIFPRQSDLLQALGLEHEEITRLVIDEGLEALWDRIKVDDEFVRAHRLESLRELARSSYRRSTWWRSPRPCRRRRRTGPQRPLHHRREAGDRVAL